MANDLHRVLIAVLLLFTIFLVNFVEAAEDDSNGPGDSRPGLLPEPSVNVNNSTWFDLNYNEISPGLLGYLRNVLSTPRQLIRNAVNLLLKTFFNQCLPCTVWSAIPMHVKCEDRCE